MISPGSGTGPRGRAYGRFIAAVLCAILATVPVVEVATSAPAGAAVRGPHCPPECGRVAAGDPLLAPYVTTNPGVGWLALPAADVQSYVDALKKNLARGSGRGVLANVAAGRWVWATGRFDLLILLVSSAHLAGLHLENPTKNAEDICAASHGEPASRLVQIGGIPGSVTGLCVVSSGSSARRATVVAFTRGDVAALIEVTSTSNQPIDPLTTAIVAGQQDLALPSNGVLVSNGPDLALGLFWLCVLAAVIFAIVATIRRRRSWRWPFDAAVVAIRRRQLALGVSLVAVIGAMAFSMVDFSLLHGIGNWDQSGFNDLWRSWSSSALMTFGGGYGHVFALDSALETAPALQVVVAPIARAAFGLSFPYPSVVLYPTAFLVAGPLFLSATALPICAGDRWLQYMGVTDLRRRVTVLGVMAVTLPPIALEGHPEDLVALGAMLYGLIAALEGRHRATGWWLGVALAFQFLAFLAVPIALVFLKRRQWLGAIVPMVAVPLSVLAVPLVTAPSTTLRQLLHQKVFDINGNITPTWHLDPGVGASIRGLVALAAIPAAIMLARVLPKDSQGAANLVVWALALLFALRVCEPELVPFFLAPALALFPVSASRAPWRRLVAAGALAVWLNWWVHFPVQARWSHWLILVAQLGLLGWLGLPRAPGRRDDAADGPARAPAAARPRPTSKARTA